MNAFKRSSLLAVLLPMLVCGPAFAKKSPPPDHWVGTWAASPVAASNTSGKYGATDTTYRVIVHVSLGGPLLRVVLTNEFGTDPLTIGAVHVALRGIAASVQLMSANALTFGGKASITIPPGAVAISDPAGLKLPAIGDLAVSIFVPAQPMKVASIHTFANQTSYSADGNVVNQASLPSPKEISAWPFLKGVDVKTTWKSGAVVCFGDSITDGAHSTKDANSRWPDLLAKRLQDGKKTKEFSVLNEGIGGNRILHDGTGPSAVARFDRDVLSQASVKYLILLEGINDIGAAANPNQPHDIVTADDLIQGMAQMAERAHTHGVKVIGATLTPYVGAKYASPAGEQMRETVNQWIRTSKLLDGFIDFEKAASDGASPPKFTASADSGDHLHPKDAGYKAMADSIDLKLFAPDKTKYDITRQE